MSVVPNDRDALALVRWVEERDADAFKELVGRYSGMVYATCRRVLGDPSEAEDAAQECFESLARFEGSPPNRLGPWLHRVATNLALKRIRSRVRREKRELAFAAKRPAMAEPHWDDVYGYVDNAIAELPDALREPLVAHFLEDRTHQAIADALGVPRQTVTDRIRRGVEEVRKTLAKRGIAITIPLLTTFLVAETAEAAPAALTATLGKLAVSGVRCGVHGAGAAAAAKVAAVGGILAMKKTVAVVVLVCAAALFSAYWAFTKPDASEEAPAVPLEGGVYEPIAKASAHDDDADAPLVERNSGDAAADEEEPATEESTDWFTDKTAFVHGRVVLEDGSPVPHCAVSLERRSVYAHPEHDPVGAFAARTTSDSDGCFVLSGLPTVSARSPLGHPWSIFSLRAEDGGLRGYRSLQMSSMALDQQVELVLRPGAVLAGVVLDQDGVPITGCEVSAEFWGIATSGEEERRRLVELEQCTDHRPAVTDRVGRFALDGLLSGTYRLYATAGGYIPTASPFFSTGRDDITITLSRGGSISGTVLDEASGEPRGGVSVRARPVTPHFTGRNAYPPLTEAEADDNGRFTIAGLAPNVYSFYVLAYDRHRSRVLCSDPGEVRLSPGEHVTDVQILVRCGGAVEGLLLEKSTGRPIPFTAVHVAPEGTRWGRITATDANGRFSFTDLEGGPYVIGDKGHRQKFSLNVIEGQVLRDIDVFLDLAGTIRGRVTDSDGKALPGATVFAQSIDSAESVSATSDTTGAYELTGFISPTDCYVQARYKNQVSARKGPFHCDSAALENVNLKVQAPGALAGRVVNRSGKGIVGIMVKAEPRSADSLVAFPAIVSRYVSRPSSVAALQAEGPYALALSGAGGRFDFGRMLADTYTVLVDDGEVSSRPLTVTLEQGAHKTDLELVVDGVDTGALEGTVTMGRPAAGVTVRAGGMQAQTDALGHYRIEDLPAKQLYASALHTSLENGCEVKREAFHEVVIPANGVARLDFDLAAGSGAVEGNVTLNGLPAFGAAILGDGFKAFTNPDGYYRAEGIPVGATTIKLEPPRAPSGRIRQDRFMYTKEVAIAESGVTRVDFHIGGGALEGAIVGIRTGEVSVVAVIPGEIVVDALGLDEFVALDAQVTHRIEMSEDGPYELPCLPPGLSTVFAVTYPADSPDHAAALAGMRVLYQFVEIVEEQTTQVDFVFE